MTLTPRTALTMRLAIVFCALVVATTLAAKVSVTRLQTEQLVAPLSVERAHPRLSWVIESGDRGVMQTAYHVRVASSAAKLAAGEADLWDSGLTASDQSVWVEYQGKPLRSNQRCFWQVKVHTTRGESEWSDVAEWGMGLLGEVSWRGQWIGWDAPFEWDRLDDHSRLSARYVRKEFVSEPKEISRATVHVSGLGLYELFINGRRIGDQVLAPAPSDYRRTVVYNSFDVTDALIGGGSANAIGVTLGNGRYFTMRQNYKPYKIPTFGYPKLRLNLIIEYADGSTQRVNSDATWRLTARGPIRSNNEYDGETYDARLDLGPWTKPGYDDAEWLQAQRVALPYGTLRGNIAPNMRVMRRLKPVRVWPSDGGWLVDFGQNMAGWVRITLRNTTSGDTIAISYAERLAPDSSRLDTENLRAAQSTDRYVCRGDEQDAEWSARFVYHGFQYVHVAGYPDMRPGDLVAEMVYDDLAPNGSFHCSDSVLNAVVRNAWWGIASNYKGVPVDCPQRDERQPWLGDHQMGAWGESFLFDNGRTYAKWSDDMREAQRDDGCLPDICPAFYNYFTSEMTWSATMPIVAEMLYHQYGDIEPMRRNYDAIGRWLAHIRGNFTTRDGVIRADKYGDWCMPPEHPKLIHSQDPARKTSGELIATAYYYRIATMMAQFGRLLGRETDAQRYETDAAEVLRCFNAKFLTVRRATSLAVKRHILCPDSVYYGNNTLTSNLLPLAFDMVPDSLREDVESNLITTIITANRGYVSCGVIGMNWLHRQLRRMGRGDVAMLLASNTTYPSFGYMLSKGATAIWELWNGDTASRRMNSCNHVMLLGDLLAWCFRDLGGINPALPGYKQLELRPDFTIDELSHVDATHHTPYGAVESRWRKDGGRLVWHLSVPCNTTALAWLPTTDSLAISDGDIDYVRRDGDATVWRIPSGKYSLDIALDPSVGPQRRGILADQFIYDEAPFPECHASTIVELDNGDLVAAFFGGTKERNPDCCIWVSRKPMGSDKWTAPVLAADGVFAIDDKQAAIAGIDSTTTLASVGPIAPTFRGDKATARRKACWNPVLYQLPGTQELLLFYKIGLNVADWTGWLVRSTDGGLTWSNRQPLGEGMLGPVKNKPVLTDGRIICPSSTEGSGGWRIHFELSDDGGMTWRKVGPLPADTCLLTQDQRPGVPVEAQLQGNPKAKPIYAIQPSILNHGNGRLQAIGRTRNAHLFTTWSNDNGSTWSQVTLLNAPNNNSGTDAVTLADGRHALVYNDFQTIASTPKGPRTPLALALSTDGINWTRSITLEDSPISQYSYPAIIQGRDGMLHIVYTWRRERIKYVKIDPRQLSY